MTARCVQLLRSLRDVEGVVGSFVWHKADGLLVRDMPVYIASSILNEVGPRIERIYEAFRGAGDELDGATLSYEHYKLHVRDLDPAYIVVLSGADVNVLTLKMAMHVVGRGVCAELETAAAPPEEAAAPQPAIDARQPGSDAAQPAIEARRPAIDAPRPAPSEAPRPASDAPRPASDAPQPTRASAAPPPLPSARLKASPRSPEDDSDRRPTVRRPRDRR